MFLRKSKDPLDYQNSNSSAAVMLKQYEAHCHINFHRHARAQLVYATRGIIELSTENKWWIVPPRFGIWMPAGVQHKMFTKTEVILNTLYIDTVQWQKDFPLMPCNVEISNLLHELLVRASCFPIEYEQNSIEWKIIDLLVEELTWAEGISLPFPKPNMDKRIQYLCRLLIENPDVNYSLDSLSKEIGTTPRTLTRLFKMELNTTYGVWRQQLKIMSAIPLLIAGKSIGQVSHEIGYGSQSTFTAMFKRFMGKTPTEYMTWINHKK